MTPNPLLVRPFPPREINQFTSPRLVRGSFFGQSNNLLQPSEM